jgi:folate-binding protein YgfZ
MSSLEDADYRTTRDTPLPVGARDDFVSTLDHLGALLFSGDDAEAFLQGQLSCNVEQVGPRSSSYGAFCTPKGRMIANFLLLRDDAGFVMVLSRDLVPAVHKQISRFVLRSKVKVSDPSPAVVLAGAMGARAERALAGVFPEVPGAPGEVRTVPGIGAIVRVRDGRWLLALTAERGLSVLAGLESHLTPADARLWRWTDIRSGLPLITAATQDQFIPQMVNLELIGGVSFEKGCYTGQEVVARTQHLGKVKRRMYLANVPVVAQAGDVTYSDDLGEQASGMVVNAEPSPDGGFDLLAVVHAASRERSTVHLKAPDGPVLRFFALPYAVA